MNVERGILLLSEIDVSEQGSQKRGHESYRGLPK